MTAEKNTAEELKREFVDKSGIVYNEEGWTLDDEREKILFDLNALLDKLMPSDEEIELQLDELLIKNGEHPTRVRNPIYGEDRRTAINLVGWFRSRMKCDFNTGQNVTK